MAIQVQIQKQPLYGKVYWDGSEFIYTPNLGFAGKDSYIYTIIDGDIAQTLTNYVNTSNTAPSVQNVSLTGNASDTITININDYVSDDNLIQPLKISRITPASKGMASIISDQIIQYQSNGNNSNDFFTFNATDGQYEVTSTVTLTIINGRIPEIPSYITDIIDGIQTDLTTIELSTGKWNETYTILNAKSAAWNSIDVERYNQIANNVESASADWNYVASRKDVYDADSTVVEANSAGWNNIKIEIDTLVSEFSSNSAHWNESDTVVNTYSASWNQNILDVNTLTTSYSTNSADWLSTYLTVSASSGFWDKTPLTNLININSGNWDISYSILCSNSAFWTDNFTDLQNFNNEYAIISSEWEGTYLTVSANSAFWDKTPLTNFVNGASANWDSSYNTLCANSGTWDSIVTDFSLIKTNYQENSSNWDSTYNTVCANSASWDKTELNNLLSANSGNWENSYSILCSTSASWNENTQNISNLTASYSSNSANWEGTYNTVLSNSASWDNTELTNLLSTNSGNWDNSYSILCSNSGTWNDNIQNVSNLTASYSSNSANWEGTYTTVSDNSASWDNTELTNLLSSNSGNWDNSYSILCGTSATWNDNVQNISNLTASYSTNSANWDGTYTTVSGNSASWDKTVLYNLLSSNSGNWDNSYSILSGNSATWDTNASAASNLTLVFQDASGAWNSAYTLVRDNSSTWDTTDLYNLVHDNSATWDDSSYIVISNSAAWNSGYQNITGLSSNYATNSGNWDTTFTFVCANSTNWGGSEPTSILSSNSAKWDNAYTVVSNGSAGWNNLTAGYVKYDGMFSAVSSNSANWIDSYTALAANSAAWKSVTTTISSNSAKWLSGAIDLNFTVNDLYASGNVVLYGNLTAQGSITELNASVVSTSAFSIVNNGYTDALAVTKSLSSGALALFNSNTNTVLYVGTSGKVGINTINPNEALTVVGNISASGYIYGQTPVEYTTFSDNSAKYDITSNYFSVNSGTVTSLLTAKSANYDPAYTYLNTTSGSINNLILSSEYYNTAYTLLTTQSATNNTSYTYLTGNSGLFGADTVYRAVSGKYEASYNIASQLSTQPCQINFIFDGNGATVNSNTFGYVQIPSNINISNWSLYADATCTAKVQILCSDYTNFGVSEVDISAYTLNGDYPILSNKLINKSSTMTSWITSVNADSILKFRLISNTLATSITLSLKCTR